MRALYRRCSLWRTRREAPHSLFFFSNALCTHTNNIDGVQSSRIKVFDRHFRRKQLDRAAWLMRSKDSFVDTVAENLLDRLEDCKKTFPAALCLGGQLEAVRRLLRGRVQIGIEARWPIFSSNSGELRIACTVAQMEREGGISPRISPLAQVRDAGNLLTRAGFTLPGVDVDEFVVRYPSALDLIEHLRAMGETNALLQRNTILKRETALATAAIYDSMFAAEDGTIPATFQVIYMTGWRDHPSQQRAKRRGSATVSFQDIQKQFGSED